MISCNSRLKDSEKNFPENYVWGSSRMSLDSIRDYKLRIVLTNTTSYSSQEQKETVDTALVFGQNSVFFSSTKANDFYTDGKYFFFFYPGNESMYGEYSKDKSIGYYNNIIQLLMYCKDHMMSHSVDSTGLYNTITIHLPKKNILNADKIFIKTSNAKEDFRIKTIYYAIETKVNNRLFSSITSIDILDYCFNTSKCHNTLNLSPTNFYKESGGVILLEGRYSNYELTKFAQW